MKKDTKLVSLFYGNNKFLSVVRIGDKFKVEKQIENNSPVKIKTFKNVSDANNQFNKEAEKMMGHHTDPNN